MNFHRALLQTIVLSGIIGLSQVSAEIRLVGMTSIDGVGRVMMEDTESHKQSGWVSVGSEVFGSTVKTIDVARSRVVLTAGAGEKTYLLAEAKTLEASKPAEEDPLFRLSDTELIKRGYNRVQRGDTGMKIAKRNGITISELQTLNPGVNWTRLTTETIVRVRKETP